MSARTVMTIISENTSIETIVLIDPVYGLTDAWDEVAERRRIPRHIGFVWMDMGDIDHLASSGEFRCYVRTFDESRRSEIGDDVVDALRRIGEPVIDDDGMVSVKLW